MDVYDSCLEYMLGGNDLSVIETGSQQGCLALILCMEQAEGDPSKAQGCFEQTNQTVPNVVCVERMCYHYGRASAGGSGCYASARLRSLRLVDGEQPSTLISLEKVCDAYTAPRLLRAV